MPTQRHLPSQIENFGHAKVHKCRAPCQSANLSPLTGARKLMSGTSRASVGFGGGGLYPLHSSNPRYPILIDRRKWMDRPSCPPYSEIPRSTHNTSTTGGNRGLHLGFLSLPAFCWTRDPSQTVLLESVPTGVAPKFWAFPRIHPRKQNIKDLKRP